MENPLSRGRPRRVLLAALALLLAAVTAAWLYSQSTKNGDAAAPSKQAARAKGKGKAGADPNRAIPVTAEVARSGDIHVYLNGLGTVIPLRMVMVRSRVDGELIHVRFTEGQLVKAGDLLAEVDPRPYQVQLDQAAGQLARDQALLANARIDLERYRKLFEQDSIAKQQVDTQAALVRQYEGTVRTDQAQVDNARLQLTYARITAPLSGRLGLRQLDPGNIVRASDTNGLVVITQTQPIAVVFTIPQDSLPAVLARIRAGNTLPVEVWDREYRTRLASGQLLTVDNQIDSTTGTVKLKAQFGNDDAALFPNQFVNARMLLDTRRGAVTVPAAALQRGSEGMFVYVVNNDSSVSVRSVKPGPTEGQTVAVESGLAAGERVVVDGMDRLREGARVEVATLRGNGGSGSSGSSGSSGNGDGGRKPGGA